MIEGTVVGYCLAVTFSTIRQQTMCYLYHDDPASSLYHRWRRRISFIHVDKNMVAGGSLAAALSFRFGVHG